MRFSEAEWKVMKVVWEHHPASVRQVYETLEESTGWAYSTVKTMLTRLGEKGALQVSKKGNASSFEPLVAAEEARRSALRSLVDRAFDGTFGSLVHHLVSRESLSARDREELRSLLEESPRGEGASPSEDEGR